MIEKKPALSVIMPSLNVGKYYRQCIESVMNQTRTDIEIICVDAGSTDGTLEILLECAAKDPRIIVIHSDVKSYGYQMNLGIERARGEYIGIVETDDWVDSDMFGALYAIAKEKNVDVVRSNYYWYWTEKNSSELFRNLKNCPCNQVIRPIDSRELFTTTPAIWSTIYRRNMLVEKGIRFNETPGASFQDASFFFMVCTVAESAYLTEKAYLHYRKDNEGSSVFAKSKTFCIQDEMKYYEVFLEQYPQQKEQIINYYTALKFEKYRWNFDRIDASEQQRFFPVMYQELNTAKEMGYLSEADFAPHTWERISLLLDRPIRYYSRFCKKYSERKEVFDYFQPLLSQRSEIENPVVSVIIPAYNAEQYLTETLESVLGSPSDLFEIVAVNDGSSDATAEILTRFAEADRKHFTVLTQINKGLGAARNAAIANAKGEFLLFLDSDDLLGEGAIETLSRIALERDVDILHFNGKSFYENTQLELENPFYLTAYQYYAQLPDVMTGPALYCKMKKDRGYFVSACLALYRKAYLERKGICFMEGVYHEDNLFTMQSMILADRAAHIKDEFLIRRVHNNSIMTTQKEFWHFYGYFMTVLREQEVVNKLPYEQDLYSYVTGEVRGITKMLYKTYCQLENRSAALALLTPVELFRAETLLRATEPKNQIQAQVRGLAPTTTLLGKISRKAYGLVKCYKEHGIKYTLRRILVHLHIAK